MYNQKSKTIHEKRFKNFDNAFSLLKEIKDCDILLEKAKNDQNKYKPDLYGNFKK